MVQFWSWKVTGNKQDHELPDGSLILYFDEATTLTKDQYDILDRFLHKNGEPVEFEVQITKAEMVVSNVHTHDS